MFVALFECLFVLRGALSYPGGVGAVAGPVPGSGVGGPGGGIAGPVPGPAVVAPELDAIADLPFQPRTHFLALAALCEMKREGEWRGVYREV